MQNNCNNQKGFTLIEVLIALAIVGVISIAISNVLLTGVNVWNFNQRQIDLQQSSRGAMILLAKDIRGALSVDTTNVHYTTNAPQDELRLRLQDENGNIDYKRWVIYENKLSYEKIDNGSPDSWPPAEDYGKKLSVTTEIISNNAIFEYDTEKRIVTINLVLEQEGKNYKSVNKVHLRREE